MNFDGAQIAAAVSGALLAGGPPGPILTDTRHMVPGAWFLALSGERFDGHAYLQTALDLGAVGAVVSQPPPAWSRGLVSVPDTTRALQDLGRAARARLSCPVVGLTGSSGKTTTRALIACALSSMGTVHQSGGNLNNHLGVPMTLLAAPEDVNVAVIEMGTSSPGEIALLCDIARPTVRLITNVGPAHLLELGGLDGVAREKGSAFATARPGDTVVVNLDDERVRALPIPSGVRRVGFGRSFGADVRVLATRTDAAFVTHARFLTPVGELLASIPAPGDHIALDAAAALAVVLALGLDPRTAAAHLADYEPVGMRMHPEHLPNGVVALNDAYNANPDSMRASLAVLAALPPRRVAVLGDMLELGPEEARFHRELVLHADGLRLELLVLVGPQMAAAGAGLATPTWATPDPANVGARLAEWLRSGDHVLFKGSRGTRVERILQSLKDEVR